MWEMWVVLYAICSKLSSIPKNVVNVVYSTVL